MKLSRLVLASALGMAVAGGIVHVMTTPEPRQPVASSANNPPIDVLGPDAAPTIAEIESEIARLLALLDASTRADVPVDAVSEAEPTDEASVQLSSAPPRPLTAPPGLAGPCAKPLPPGFFEFFLSQFPQYRQLPPDQLELMRRAIVEGSSRCSCFVGSAGDAACADWCRGKGLASGRCGAEGLCACF